VTIRITRVEVDGEITLRVDGQLVGDDAEELLRVCEGLLEPLTLDLGGLRFVDSRGISVLRDLQAKGVTLGSASPFIRLLLGQPATDDDPS